MNHKIFVCENSIEGIFTGVYDAWKAAREIGHSHCKLETLPPDYGNGTMKEQSNPLQVRDDCRNYELFSEYIYVKTDQDKAEKVTKTVCERMGYPVYKELSKAILAEAPDLLYGGRDTDYDKGDAVYRTIVTGLSMKSGDEVLTNLTNPYVARVFELTRRVGNEYLHWIEFLRFHELKSGVMFARIAPENNLLAMMAPHFADRLPLENFMIYDERRGLFIIHGAGDPENPVPIENTWAIVQGEKPDEEAITDYSDREEYYQELFTSFCKTIAIESRVNTNLQRQMLPLKFRKYMVEFEQFHGKKSMA
ncbi:MAG: TIGR03915 family putative DNA repair protein [bacterium]|nr:TIGR03915 family putative DNA repair protein [bacterium]